jgi:hypothetical protein
MPQQMYSPQEPSEADHWERPLYADPEPDASPPVEGYAPGLAPQGPALHDEYHPGYRSLHQPHFMPGTGQRGRASSGMRLALAIVSVIGLISLALSVTTNFWLVIIVSLAILMINLFFNLFA